MNEKQHAAVAYFKAQLKSDQAEMDEKDARTDAELARQELNDRENEVSKQLEIETQDTMILVGESVGVLRRRCSPEYVDVSIVNVVPLAQE